MWTCLGNGFPRGKGRPRSRRSRACRSCGSAPGSGCLPFRQEESRAVGAVAGGARGPDRQETADARRRRSHRAHIPGPGSRASSSRPRPDVSTPAMMWCTTLRLPGLKSTARIQRSSGRSVLSTKTRKSSSPAAASVYGSGIVRVRSGSPSGQSDENLRGSGRPSGRPPDTRPRPRPRAWRSRHPSTPVRRGTGRQSW